MSYYTLNAVNNALADAKAAPIDKRFGHQIGACVLVDKLLQENGCDVQRLALIREELRQAIVSNNQTCDKICDHASETFKQFKEAAERAAPPDDSYPSYDEFSQGEIEYAGGHPYELSGESVEKELHSLLLAANSRLNEAMERLDERLADYDAEPAEGFIPIFKFPGA